MPKIEQLERDLELLDQGEVNDDGSPKGAKPKDQDLANIVPGINKAVDDAKQFLKQKRANQTKNEADKA